MLGQKSFDITAEDFVKGMSSTSTTRDGGWSPDTQAVNLTQFQGWLYGASNTQGVSATPTGHLIASTEDTTNDVTAFDRILVDDLGNYYKWVGSTLTLIATDATHGSNGYVVGTTNMVGYSNGGGGGGEVYTTTTFGITRLSALHTSPALDETFYTSSWNASARHPSLLYQNNVYYGNGNLLLRQTTVGTPPTVILTLPLEQNIVALGTDPGTGYMLISVSDGVNYSDALNRVAKVLYYDGFSNKVLKAVIVDDMVTAFQSTAGVTYVFYGQNFGYWTGAGIQFIRKLNVSLQGASLAYQNKVTNVGRTLVAIEGSKLIAYGEVVNGRKYPYYIYQNYDSDNTTTRAPSMIFYTGSNKVVFGWTNGTSVGKLREIDLTDVSDVGIGGGSTWYSNQKLFPRNITVNGIVIEFGTALPTSNPIGSISIIGDTNVATDYGTSFTNTIAGKYTMEFWSPTLQTRSFIVKYTFLQNTPIQRFTVFYSDKE